MLTDKTVSINAQNIMKLRMLIVTEIITIY